LSFCACGKSQHLLSFRMSIIILSVENINISLSQCEMELSIISFMWCFFFWVKSFAGPGFSHCSVILNLQQKPC
jgi:hypothetical protein